jgi:hypothetical protein
MREHDQPVLLDFNGDGRKDLALFNGQDWAVKGLATFVMTTNTALQLAQLHVITVGPWKMAAHDLFRAGDVNGDGRDDLVVLNALDWGAPEKFLGTLRSTGNGGFTGGVQNLSALYGLAVFGTGDFAVADYQGGQNWDDLFLVWDPRPDLASQPAERLRAGDVLPEMDPQPSLARAGLVVNGRISGTRGAPSIARPAGLQPAGRAFGPGLVLLPCP